ncbi:hypothetical protein RND71_011278 [Anisodus tanguticus]|uniref:Uncharacterized protein n=1 Tax=Anisodus tanguticus TaxID=243964 RepID=A0AAE1SD25_9SOLA|nr:hypothetical protein RND71_011278 [Anisodus tanguticus]
MSDIALCNYSKDNLNETEIYQNGWCAIEMSLEDERSHSGDDPRFPVKVTQVTEPSGPDAEARSRHLKLRKSIRKRRVNYLAVSCPALSRNSHSNQPMRPGQQCPSFSNIKSNAVECTVKSTILGGEGGIEEGTGFQAASPDLTAENKICRKFACADNDAYDDKELIDVSVMVEEGDGEPPLNFGMLPVESVLGDAKASEGSKESPLLK